MASSGRKKIIAANWKMYKTIPEAERFVKELAPAVEEAPVQVYLAAPFTAIYPLAEMTKGTKLVIGAQNMNDASEGAFTGEVAARMLTDAGAQFVILGHSERRRLFKESDTLIHRKVAKALASGLQPLLCVGESAEEREAGTSEQVVTEQLHAALNGLDKKAANRVVIAYEPIWAIGTGHVATSQEASEMHAKIRQALASHWGEEAAAGIPILYGGSVKPETAPELFDQPEIDGFLVGGASLSVESFTEILNLTLQKEQL